MDHEQAPVCPHRHHLECPPRGVVANEHQPLLPTFLSRQNSLRKRIRQLLSNTRPPDPVLARRQGELDQHSPITRDNNRFPRPATLKRRPMPRSTHGSSTAVMPNRVATSMEIQRFNEARTIRVSLRIRCSPAPLALTTSERTRTQGVPAGTALTPVHSRDITGMGRRELEPRTYALRVNVHPSGS